jgi:hypothetical protein
MECICGDGSSLEPMVIISGQLMKEKHFMNDLSNNILLAVSETGYTNDLLSFEWLKHFNDQTEEKAGGEPRLWSVFVVMDRV